MSDPAPTDSAPQATIGVARTGRYRWRFRVRWAVLAVAALVAGGELVSRLGLGLGDPPLLLADPEIEYLFQPSRRYRRFGNRVAYNAYSMRSDDFPKTKNSASELRVLVLGDSVVNGGSLTDQSQLATQLLQSRLSADLKRPVVVGNVSAGSWGPANMLAYVRRFGLFGADVVAIVLSSHDDADHPTFDPMVGHKPSFPEHSPILALQELFTKYLPRYLRLPHWTDPPSQEPETVDRHTIAQATAALRQLIGLVQDSGARVLIVQHLEMSELQGHEKQGHQTIANIAAQMGAPTIQLGPAFAQALREGRNPYRDNIHPNAHGQRVITRVLLDAIKAAVPKPSASRPGGVSP